MQQLIFRFIAAIFAFAIGIAVQTARNVFQFSEADNVELSAVHHCLREASPLVPGLQSQRVSL
ncbi:MAG: hypothetical protein H0T92_14930 [Pyrinomonadaceae bacterium]|jgi:hypothetical protein|nr:hypothetical protein [Pyrinomonadaceae bacterium]